MIKTFVDEESAPALHEAFQEWRRRHPEGVFANCK